MCAHTLSVQPSKFNDKHIAQVAEQMLGDRDANSLAPMLSEACGNNRDAIERAGKIR